MKDVCCWRCEANEKEKQLQHIDRARVTSVACAPTSHSTFHQVLCISILGTSDWRKATIQGVRDGLISAR
eukprot:1153944-Pelagomonas_calceolata.AAC.1